MPQRDEERREEGEKEVKKNKAKEKKKKRKEKLDIVRKEKKVKQPETNGRPGWCGSRTSGGASTQTLRWSRMLQCQRKESHFRKHTDTTHSYATQLQHSTTHSYHTASSQSQRVTEPHTAAQRHKHCKYTLRKVKGMSACNALSLSGICSSTCQISPLIEIEM